MVIGAGDYPIKLPEITHTIPYNSGAYREYVIDVLAHG